jgi:hypothetical protein
VAANLRDRALAAHREEAREHRRAREERERERAVEAAARRRPPESLGLEECPDCGWWRDPVPETARTSPPAFRTYLAMARARCMCTTSRCFQCHEPVLEDRPVPSYYSPASETIRWAGGFVVAMAHRARCGQGGAG